MKIGYSVEGATDRAFLNGLKERWCSHAELIEGRFRGSSSISQRREIPQTCLELQSKGADVIVFMRDANNENWRTVLRDDQKRCKPEHQHLTLFAVCDRNIESWLCTDPGWIAKETNRPVGDFKSGDPKNVFESALEITSRERKEDRIAGLVGEAPLREWLSNQSFKAFFDSVWRKSKELGCPIENLASNPRQ